MPLWLLVLVLLADGWLCGIISIKVHQKCWPGWTIFISTTVSALVWWGMARDQSKSLAYLSILFDVTYAGGFFMMLVLTGEQISAFSWLGAALAIAGVALMGLQG